VYVYAPFPTFKGLIPYEFKKIEILSTTTVNVTMSTTTAQKMTEEEYNKCTTAWMSMLSQAKAFIENPTTDKETQDYKEVLAAYQALKAWEDKYKPLNRDPNAPIRATWSEALCAAEEEAVQWRVFDCIWIYDPENDSLGDDRNNDEYFATYEEALACWQDRCTKYENIEEGVDSVYLEAMGGDLDEFNLYPIDTVDYWERISQDKYKSEERVCAALLGDQYTGKERTETAIYNGVELPRYVDGREVVSYPNAGRVPKD